MYGVLSGAMFFELVADAFMASVQTVRSTSNPSCIGDTTTYVGSDGALRTSYLYSMMYGERLPGTE